MVKIGQFNTLTVTDAFPFGFYLRTSATDDVEDAVLLPKEAAPENCEIGQQFDVFVYHDQDDRLTASLKSPKATLDGLAFLKVKHIAKAGAFLDWGLPKDLLVPNAEQDMPMQEGLAYVVYVYQEDDTERLAATTKLRKFLSEYNENTFSEKQPVSLQIFAKTDLGYKAVINDTHLGLIFKDEVIRPLRIGDKVEGFIRHIREDDKIDLCFQFHDKQARLSLAEQILEDLEAHGGISTLTDKSPADEISQRFGCSKGAYKKALGALYKQKKILLDKSKITLIQK